MEYYNLFFALCISLWPLHKITITTKKFILVKRSINKEEEDNRNEAVVLDLQVIITVAKMIKGNLKLCISFLVFLSQGRKT